MTNSDLTYIGVLVDRSGSMDTMRAEMEREVVYRVRLLPRQNDIDVD